MLLNNPRNLNDANFASFREIKLPVKEQNERKGSKIESADDSILELQKKIQFLDDIESKRLCCCFTRNGRGKLLFSAVVGLILILIAIVFYFVYPRIPDFELESVELTQSQPKITGSDLNFTVKYPLIVKIKVYNPNYYNIKTNSIVINAYISPNLTLLSKTNFPGSLLSENVDDYKIGESILKNTNFPKGETKKLNAILRVEYSPNSEFGVLNDPYLGEILRICSDQGRTDKDTVKIINKIDIEIGILSSFGYIPRIVKDVNIQCPISSSVLKQLAIRGLVSG